MTTSIRRSAPTRGGFVKVCVSHPARPRLRTVGHATGRSGARPLRSVERDGDENPLGAAPVEPDCPGVDRFDPEMGLAPRIACECGADGVLRLGLDDVRHAMLVGERPAQDNEARLHEAVHKGGMRGPVELLLQRPRRVPPGAGTAEHNEERRHPRILRPYRSRPLATAAVWLARYGARTGSDNFLRTWSRLRRSTASRMSRTECLCRASNARSGTSSSIANAHRTSSRL